MKENYTYLIKIIVLLIVIGFINTLNGQQWSIVTSRGVQESGIKDIIPDKYLLANVNDDVIRSRLWKAPSEDDRNTTSELLLNVMLDNGRMDQFSIIEYQMMEDGLAEKYPDFKTFLGKSTSDPNRNIRIDYTILGFRAVISDSKGRIYIDHYQRNDRNHKIIYRKEDAVLIDDWLCYVEELPKKTRIKEIHTRAGDCLFRTYRLAMAATGEYTAFHGGTVALGQASIVTAVNRVNQIYEQDLSVRLILVANNDLLVYTNASTDPYTNGSPSNLLTQNQSNVDELIGDNNYDIGHVFSTGGGGLASLGVVCISGSKARGETGLPSPIGDPFYIDFVAHELGHQFGGNHTFNGTESNCSGSNRNDNTAVEPGSGTTIMAYAGICGSQNVQSNSDAYFHAISIEEISNIITLPSDCAVTSSINNPPVLSPVSNYTVPASTPLILDVIATDQDGDNLTYCWEQIDNETGFAIPPQSTNTGGAMFRSLSPTSDSTRYLPSIDNIVNGTTDTWEVLPSVDRVMNFRVTVRDHALMAGCTDEVDMAITTSGTSGPFEVTSFNGPQTFLEGEVVNVTWNIANTDMAPINCSNVDILLSVDGGYTYPTTLASSAPNDGSESVTIPPGTTTVGRIMVKGSGNIFFDINNADFEIQPGSPTFTLNTIPSSGEICNNSSIQFDVVTSSIMDFNTPINLSIGGLPPGASFNYSVNPVIPGNTSTVTLNNFGNNTGPYLLTITGTADAIIKQVTFNLNLIGILTDPLLLAPSNMSTGETNTPILSWNSVAGTISYDYEISTFPNGVGIIESGNTITTSHQIINPLSNLTTYYWRVRSNNLCGPSGWSSNWRFTTGSCTIINFFGSPIPISSSGKPSITSDINLPVSGAVTDLNIINLSGTHTRISDLRFTVTSPSTTSVIIMDRVCGNEDDFDINFDDEATSSTIPCPPTGGGTYQPANLLSSFDGEEVNGLWTLTVKDEQPPQGGALSSWGIKVCYDVTCQLIVTNTSSSGSGSLKDAVLCAAPGETITLSSSLANMTIDLGNSGLIFDKELTIEANPIDNITVTSSGIVPTVSIDPGIPLTLKGFQTTSSSPNSETISNQGILTLEDMIIRNEMSNEQIINETSSQLIIIGSANLRK